MTRRIAKIYGFHCKCSACQGNWSKRFKEKNRVKRKYPIVNSDEFMDEVVIGYDVDLVDIFFSEFPYYTNDIPDS